MARTRLIQAIHDAVVEEMARDPKVIVYGEDVELSIVGDLRGVHEQFGHTGSGTPPSARRPSPAWRSASRRPATTWSCR